MKIDSLFKAVKQPTIIIESLKRRSFYAKMKWHSNIFSSEKMRSRIYVPYYKTDLIQFLITSTRNYYEIDQLDYVCKEWNGGIIGEAIKVQAVLDVGTNIGNHTLYYLNECNAAFVYCFEPIEDTFRILKKNVKINHLEGKTQLNMFGIGEHSGKADINEFDNRNIGGTSIKMTDSGAIEVKAIDELNITRKIGLIKIDVEGLEIEAMKGMIETIRRNHPYITVEINKDHFDDINLMLYPLGYTYHIIADHKTYKDYLFY